MSDDGVLEVGESLRVPRSELSFRATRAGGPGGQHVNTSATRVELAWNVDASPSLSDEQRERIRERLSNRINAEGVLLLTAREHRSQHQNREAVLERFVELVGKALVVQAPRRRTRPSRAQKEARLQAKRQRSELKHMRRAPID